MKLIGLYYLYFISILITFSLCVVIKHPNSMKKTIDYSRSGDNWVGVCKSGVRQSPISIDRSNRVEKDILKLKYGNSKGNLVWNGSFYKIDLKDTNSKVIFTDIHARPPKEHEYILKRIIFRTPPEHIVQGKVEDMEMQFFHESTDKKLTNNLLAISIPAKITKSKKMVDDWFKNLDTDPKAFTNIEGIDKVMISLKDYFHYAGSQTVPNCVENVNWIVFKKPMLMEQRLFNTLQKNFCKREFPKGNARHIQNNVGREIIEYSLKEE